MGKKLSEEKIKKLEDMILQMPEASNQTIADLVGTGTSSVSKYRKKLIDEGRLTKEKVNAEREKKKAKEKADSKAQDPKRKAILTELEDGKYYDEIAKDVNISVSTLTRIIKELIEDGETTQGKIDAARERRKQREKEAEKQNPQGIQEVTDELMKKVLSEMRKGLIGRRITKKLGLGKGIFAKIRRKLINSSAITPEEIKRAQEKRRNDDREEVYALRMQGYSIQEMLSMIEDSEEDYLIELEKELRAMNRLSNEIIEQAKYDRKYRQISDFVLAGYNRGLNAREIAEAYEIVYGERLGQRNVNYYKEKLSARGLILGATVKDKTQGKDGSEKEDLVQEYNERNEEMRRI